MFSFIGSLFTDIRMYQFPQIWCLV